MDIEKLIELFGLDPEKRKMHEYEIKTIRNAYEHSRKLRITESEAEAIKIIEKQSMKEFREWKHKQEID